MAIAQLCRWFGVPRSTFYYRGERRRRAELDRDLVELVGRLIAANPEYGLRRLTVLVRRELREAVNRKRIHRILKGNGWQIWQRPRGQRPRVQGWVSRVEQPNARWAIDATHVFCGRDGWCPLTAIIDCCDRTIVGWRLSRSGVARIAAAALEDALRDRGIEYGHEPLGQRPRVRREGLREGRASLWPRPGVHHALLPRAEWDDREVLPDAEGGVPMASPLPESGRLSLPSQPGSTSTTLNAHTRRSDTSRRRSLRSA